MSLDDQVGALLEPLLALYDMSNGLSEISPDTIVQDTQVIPPADQALNIVLEKFAMFKPSKWTADL